MEEKLQSRGYFSTISTELQISTMKLILLVVLSIRIWSGCWDAAAQDLKVSLFMNFSPTRV